MPTIKIQLEREELDAVKRHADALGIKVSDLAYGALNCLMCHSLEPYCRGRTKLAIGERAGDLPLWSDSARSISMYESKGGIAGHRGPRAID